MQLTSKTHIEKLVAWVETSSVPVGSTQGENRWVSPLLPTRRFGPDAWVSCSLHLSPTSTDLGPFEAWTVLDSKELRVIAYLERPLADAFGVVPTMSRPALPLAALPDALVQGLGRASERFFAQDPASSEDQAAVAAILELASEDLANSWREVIAPDFFSWLSISEMQANGSDQGVRYRGARDE